MSPIAALMRRRVLAVDMLSDASAFPGSPEIGTVEEKLVTNLSQLGNLIVIYSELTI